MSLGNNNIILMSGCLFLCEFILKVGNISMRKFVKSDGNLDKTLAKAINRVIVIIQNTHTKISFCPLKLVFLSVWSISKHYRRTLNGASTSRTNGK
jgi:hypothetical protein